MGRIAVRLIDVTKTFRDTVAVRELSLDVEKGSLTTLLGPSGCGKTTTLRLIAGFYEPDHGEIYIGDRRVNRVPPFKRNTAMVFQDYALFPHMNVFDNIAYGLKVRRLPINEMKERVRWVMDLVGLKGLENRSIGQLSGGQQQRVALARALVVEPEVLLLDEPLSNLDAKLRVRVRAEIRAIQKRLQMTTIYVTHDQEEALCISDKIVVMNMGRKVQEGAPMEVYFHPRNRFVADFLGVRNFIKGKVLDIVSDKMLVKISGGEVLSIPVNPDVKVGNDVLVTIRSETINISKKPLTGENVLKGKIESAYFLGPAIQYVVKVDGAEMLANVVNRRPSEILKGEVYLKLEEVYAILS